MNTAFWRGFVSVIWSRGGRSLAAGVATLALAGCVTETTPIPPQARVAPQTQTLNPGDVLKISFPGAPNLDTTQQIRRDGRINLYMLGEVTAADKTPGGLEEELVKAYAPQLISKEVKVTVVSSSFSVMVTGAVLKPGKLAPDRAITAFEAVMEAGGFDSARANTKEVRVIRHENGQPKTYTLNMKPLLEGGQAEPFYLKAHDIVFVPERISWF